MATIHNPTIRIFHMPALVAPRGADGLRERVMASPGMLAPGAVLTVPDAYLEGLVASRRGWRARLAVKGNAASVKHPTGVAGAFESVILAARSAKKKTEAETTSSRLAALEAEAAAAKKERAADADPEDAPTSAKGRRPTEKK